ncbi:MAG: hypothetical protein KJ971_01260 [Firmicutes bacterium]|nr:hypothetical protein [Bacillota bacterium]
MKSYIKLIDDLPLVLKVVLALPGIDNIVYGIYRIAKGQLIIGILWIIFGGFILCIIDIYTLLTQGKITFLV